jgi:type III restriction enzyme
VDGEWEMVDEEWFFGEGGWSLLDFPPQLTEGEFSIKREANQYEIDLKGKKITERFVGAQMALDLSDVATMTDLQLSRWFDKRLRRPDVRQEEMLEFIRRTIDYLLSQRQIPLRDLILARFPLEKALRQKINAYREQALSHGYQQTLFAPDAPVQTTYNYAFTFDHDDYPAHWSYSGSYQFNKHYYPRVGELKDSGEEFECARALDQQKQVAYWVRNLEKQPDFSFWLPLANGRFYPDFVAKLKDGRILVLEYKGEHLLNAPDTKEKQNIGELWEEKSDGKALFLMAVKRDEQGRNVYQQIEHKISGR